MTADRRAETLRVGRWLLPVLWIAAFVAFHAWNFVHYDPVWGYDGREHMRVMETYHQTGHRPPSGYGSTNPPLYYLVTGAIWGRTHAIKIVQLFSLLLFGVNVWILKGLLWSATRNPWMRWSALSFGSYLPVHLAYAYMVFNYGLSHTLELGAVYCLYSFACRARTRRLVAAGVLAGLGIVTALTTLYVAPLGVFTAFAFGPRSFCRRLLHIGAFAAALGATVAPFYRYEKGQKCFLCTGNRSATNKSFSEVYPLHFYIHFSPVGLLHPYYPNHFFDGLWNLIYETAFDDYFGYLIPGRLTDVAGRNKRGLASTGRHFIDHDRQVREGILGLVAVPSAIALLIGAARAAGKSIIWLVRMRRMRAPLSAFTGAASLLCFYQFLAYIHRYPNYVNIHAGYILVIFLLLAVEVARTFRARWARDVTAAAFSAYAVGAAFVFLLR